MASETMEIVFRSISQALDWMMSIYNASGYTKVVISSLALLIAVGYIFSGIVVPVGSDEVNPPSGKSDSVNDNGRPRKMGGGNGNTSRGKSGGNNG